MDIKELTNANVQLVIPAKELSSIIYQCVCKALAEHTVEASTEHANNNGGKLYTADEVCALLHVTKPTLWRWAKADYLCPLKVGTKNFYKYDDVQNLMTK